MYLLSEHAILVDNQCYPYNDIVICKDSTDYLDTVYHF